MSVRGFRHGVYAALAVLVSASAGPALAQMPDLRAISGKPLPVNDVPPGTVVVRVVRQTMANAAVGVEVSATTRAPSGDARTGVMKTGADGRALFSNLPRGSEFQATVTVDGESLQSEAFPVPVQGGVRVLLIAGLSGGGHSAGAEPAVPPGAQGVPGAEGVPGAAPPGAQTFRMGAPTGRATPASDLPKGTLEIEVRSAAGQPMANQQVRLGQIHLTPTGADRGVKEQRAVTDARGMVRFTDLATGQDNGFVAVTEHQGLRLSVEPFRMPEDSGMRGQILALRRTSDPSVLRLDPRSKVIVDLREEALAVMIGLFFRNTSQEIFDPGPQGLIIPMPEAAVNAQEIEGGEPLEILPGKGIRIRSIIPPDSAASFVSTARYGYILPTGGDRTLELKQVMPIALPDPFILVPEKTGLGLEGPGLRPGQDDVDGTGDKVKVFTTDPIAAGGTLALTVTNIPARARTGRVVASVLCALLIAGALAGVRRRRGPKTATDGTGREELIARRETLFGELVELDRERKTGGESVRSTDRRKQLVTELETVYRNLARLEELGH
jgi:hypothetical protein